MINKFISFLLKKENHILPKNEGVYYNNPTVSGLLAVAPVGATIMMEFTLKTEDGRTKELNHFKNTPPEFFTMNNLYVVEQFSIDHENYEIAAICRDKIKQLEKLQKQQHA